jgi:1-acyl-sn-glycerol-3-phosphate acyltransferase
VLRGPLVILLLFLNTAFWGTLVLLVGLVKLPVPRSELRRRLILIAAWLGERWVGVNNRIFDALLPVQWHVEGVDIDDPRGHYLVISNHVSWVDIFALFRIFHRRAAFIRFFMKSQLIWMPVVGQACAALEFPFMRRYSPDYLARHPEKRGRDLVMARRMCRRYRRVPVAVAIFLEGTRFTREKQENQESPYRNLLRPRVGALSFALAALGDQLDAVLDVALAYPEGETSMWDFVSGRLRKVRVIVRRLDVPPEFLTESVDREKLKLWIDEVWRQKDDLLGADTQPSENSHSPHGGNAVAGATSGA